MTKAIRIFLIKCLAFLLLFYSFNYLFSILIDRYLLQLKGQKMYWNLAIHDQNLDYCVLGSSRALNNVDINQIDSISGKQGINLSHPGSGFIDNYLTLIRFFEQRNKTSLVMLQVDPFALYSDSSFSYPFHDFLFMPYYSHNETITHAINTESRFSSNKWLWNLAPFTKYMEFSSQFDLFFFRNGRKKKEIEWNNNQGSEKAYRSEFAPNMERKAKTFMVLPKDAFYLDQIVKLCRRQNCRIAFFTAPIYQELYQAYDLTKYSQYIDSLTKVERIPFHNFMNHSISSQKSNFIDYTHLSQKGVYSFSELLAAQSF